MFRPSLSLIRIRSTRQIIPQSRLLSYFEEKQKAKERRREKYQTKVQRLEAIQTRRPKDGQRGQSRDIFHRWFTKKKVDEEYMDRKARQAGLDWRIQVAVILERTNVVLPDKEEWEIEFNKLQSHLAQYDAPLPVELGGIDPDDKSAFKTEEELLAMLPDGYKPAPRETEADKSGDVKTVNRKLKTSIYLTVQDDKEQWTFPTVALQEDETLLDAAKRALKEQVGERIEYWSITNAPCAVDMKASENTSDGYYGTKTFFMKLTYDEGDVLTTGVKDYAWLDRQEMVERIQSKDQSKFYHYLL